MSEEKHTPGRIHACRNGLCKCGYLYSDDGEAFIAKAIGKGDGVDPHPMEEEQMANARRIAACWNACQGISTDDLESGRVAVVTTEDYRFMERALRVALRCLPDPDRPKDVYAMANPFAVAVTVKEALSRVHQSAPTTTPKGSPLIRHGKCDYCGDERDVRPTPTLADAAIGAKTCEACWNVTREGGIAAEGIDVGEFRDVGQKPSGDTNQEEDR